MNKTRFLLLTLFGIIILILTFAQQTMGQSQGQSQISDQVHTPAKGTAERKAILDAVHEYYKDSVDHPTQFLVNYLKVHNGWAWINVTPLNEKGKPVGETAPLLYHNDGNKWIGIDLYQINNEDPDDHVGPEEPSAKYIKALQTQYPGVPKDIIPKIVR